MCRRIRRLDGAPTCADARMRRRQSRTTILSPCCANSGSSSRRPARCASPRCSWSRRCAPTCCRASTRPRAATSSSRRRPTTPVVAAQGRVLCRCREEGDAGGGQHLHEQGSALAQSAGRRPAVPPLFPRPRPPGAAAPDEPGLGRDRVAGRLRAHQPPRDPGRRRHPARAERRPPRFRARCAAPIRNRISPCSRPTPTTCPRSRWATPRTCRSATSCSRSAIRSASATR